MNKMIIAGAGISIVAIVVAGAFILTNKGTNNAEQNRQQNAQAEQQLSPIDVSQAQTITLQPDTTAQVFTAQPNTFYKVTLGDKTFYGKLVRINDTFTSMYDVFEVGSNGIISDVAEKLQGPEPAFFVNNSAISEVVSPTSDEITVLTEASENRNYTTPEYISEDISDYINQSTYQVLYTTNGNEVFALIKDFDGQFGGGIKTFSLKETNPANPSDLSLVADLVDISDLTQKDISYWANLTPSSQIKQAIEASSGQ